jgi:hypothetical protein
MHHKNTGSYDEIPRGMKVYLNNYGCHFNKKLCEEAVSRMYRNDNKALRPYSKEQVDKLLETHNIAPKRMKLYDHVYVANMGLFDYLGSSIPDEKHLAMFIKDTLDDPDADEGFVFNRFYADTIFMNDPIEWEDVI